MCSCSAVASASNGGLPKLERLETALAHAYDVIEICVPNKKNFQFGVMGL